MTFRGLQRACTPAVSVVFMVHQSLDHPYLDPSIIRDDVKSVSKRSLTLIDAWMTSRSWRINSIWVIRAFYLRTMAMWTIMPMNITMMTIMITMVVTEITIKTVAIKKWYMNEYVCYVKFMLLLLVLNVITKKIRKKGSISLLSFL